MGNPPDPDARRPAAEALAEVGRLLAQSLDPDVVAQRIVDSVLALVGGRLATLYRLDESGDLEALAFTGHGGAAYGRGMRIPAGSGAVGLAVLRRRPVTTPDLLTDPSIRLTPEVRARIEEARHRAVLAVPLLIKDRVIGALGIGDREGRVFGSSRACCRSSDSVRPRCASSAPTAAWRASRGSAARAPGSGRGTSCRPASGSSAARRSRAARSGRPT